MHQRPIKTWSAFFTANWMHFPFMMVVGGGWLPQCQASDNKKALMYLLPGKQLCTDAQQLNL